MFGWIFRFIFGAYFDLVIQLTREYQCYEFRYHAFVHISTNKNVVIPILRVAREYLKVCFTCRGISQSCTVSCIRSTNFNSIINIRVCDLSTICTSVCNLVNFFLMRYWSLNAAGNASQRSEFEYSPNFR